MEFCWYHCNALTMTNDTKINCFVSSNIIFLSKFLPLPQKWLFYSLFKSESMFTFLCFNLEPSLFFAFFPLCNIEKIHELFYRKSCICVLEYFKQLHCRFCLSSYLLIECSLCTMFCQSNGHLWISTLLDLLVANGHFCGEID